MNSRKEEILAKRAKLEAIKRQREARQKEFSTSRSALDLSDVRVSILCRDYYFLINNPLGSFHVNDQTHIKG